VALPICIEMTKMTSFFKDLKEKKDRGSICTKIFKTLCENKVFDSAIKLARSFTHSYFKYLAFKQILVELCLTKDISRVIELQNMVCLLNIKREIHPNVINLLCEHELFDQAICFMNQTNNNKSYLVKIIAIALCKQKLFDKAIDLIDIIDQSINEFDQIDETVAEKRNSIKEKYYIIEDICINPEIENVEDLISKLINKISDIGIKDNLTKILIKKFCIKNKFCEAIQEALTIFDVEKRGIAFDLIKQSVCDQEDNNILTLDYKNDLLQCIDMQK